VYNACSKQVRHTCTRISPLNMSASIASSAPTVASRRQSSRTTAPAAARPLASSAFKAGAASAFFGSVGSRAPRQVTTCAANGTPSAMRRTLPAQASNDLPRPPNRPNCPRAAPTGSSPEHRGPGTCRVTGTRPTLRVNLLVVARLARDDHQRCPHPDHSSHPCSPWRRNEHVGSPFAPRQPCRTPCTYSGGLKPKPSSNSNETGASDGLQSPVRGLQAIEREADSLNTVRILLFSRSSLPHWTHGPTTPFLYLSLSPPRLRPTGHRSSGHVSKQTAFNFNRLIGRLADIGDGCRQAQRGGGGGGGGRRPAILRGAFDMFAAEPPLAHTIAITASHRLTVPSPPWPSPRAACQYQTAEATAVARADCLADGDRRSHSDPS